MDWYGVLRVTGIGPDIGVKMSNQAQIDAIEHLLLAVLKRSGTTFSDVAIEEALASLMRDDAPGGLERRGYASDYLAEIRARLG